MMSLQLCSKHWKRINRFANNVCYEHLVANSSRWTVFAPGTFMSWRLYVVDHLWYALRRRWAITEGKLACGCAMGGVPPHMYAHQAAAFLFSWGSNWADPTFLGCWCGWWVSIYLPLQIFLYSINLCGCRCCYHANQPTSFWCFYKSAKYKMKKDAIATGEGYK